MQENSALGRAIAVVTDLRNRCPWDRAQSRQTLRPYLVEEVLELDQALGQEDPDRIRDETGDFLLHLAWQFVIAAERGEFTPAEIATELEAKMRRRHPHLYDLGPAEPWQRLKKKEGRRHLLDVTYRFAGRDDGEQNTLNEELLIRLHESGVAVPSYTTLQGRYCLRVALCNHRTHDEDLRVLIDTVLTLGSALA